MLQISKEEYRQRLLRLGASVAEAGLDLFLVQSFDSIYYLTGAGFEPFERPFFLLVFPNNTIAPILLVPKLEAEHMTKAHNIDEVHSYWEYPAPRGRGWTDRLRNLVGANHEVGVEPSTPRGILDDLGDLTTRCVPLVERLRLVKTRSEIEMIRRAARYADLGVEQLLDAAYRAASVAEGFARNSVILRKIIRETQDFEPVTSKVALVVTRVNGYAAESERTCFTVPPATEIRKAFDAMMEARRRAFALIRPGVSCSDLDEEVNEFLRSEGYGSEDQRLHRTGHGLGLGNHEAPWIAEGSKDVLARNMVISIEPGIYVKDSGGLRHSYTVLVTHDGCESLTSFPTDLESLTIHNWKVWTRVKGALIRRAIQVHRKERAEHSIL